ncbi:MAG: UDP-N-acetylmuramoyl-L-alanyl-D-glutamate--2,6-diaminopimelate ligase, partial [Candidatus Latescibacteria bacterium]|nr:UDP-N-acetylmuramoyl-L-alanyl-D-glutamate--2,6-diaminopimelate ligase [Candidatus Latescibacterota bacterium]
MRLQDLISTLPEARLLRGGDPEVTGLVADSRQVGPGFAFVAIRGGEEEDRHAYVPDAVAAGAAAVVVEEDVEAGPAAVLQVNSTRRALAVMAERFYGSPCDSLRVVGVTGTNGKTTTAYLIRAILKTAGWQPGMISTVEYFVGARREPSANTTPEADSLQRMFREMVEGGCRSAVMEVTSHGLVLDRVYGIPFEAAVFTNLSRDHLNFHKTEDAYLAAKAMLFDNLDSRAHAVVNIDDPAAERLVACCRGQIVTYGTCDDADIRILEGRADRRGTALSLGTPSGPMELSLALRGRFNLWNGAAAAGVGLAMGADPRTIEEAMRDVRVPGRFEEVDLGQPFAVIVDFAHTPDSLENALRAARGLAEERLISVFGCGGDRDRGKRPQMGRISGDLADRTIVTSDNPRTEDPEAIIAEILPGVGDSVHSVEPDRERAISEAIRTAQSGDVVLIAGKGHEDYQIVGRERRHFDDREVAREVLESIG